MTRSNQSPRRGRNSFSKSISKSYSRSSGSKGMKERSPDDKNGFGFEANNLYIKNIPDDFTEDDLVHLFEPFGHIKSSAIKASRLG